ncbi:hypothetical protein AAFF_G00395890 [Aldrovandia affinis]|uniref:Uncharacterized protein n=1 Tax=Aldrovandia affinis TaxID=143900 RepID=A0AAD7SDA2_9TELE|nr:hypothetical protein AAFF_G00395890 [Aldrovandia affinis]
MADEYRSTLAVQRSGWEVWGERDVPSSRLRADDCEAVVSMKSVTAFSLRALAPLSPTDDEFLLLLSKAGQNRTAGQISTRGRWGQRSRVGHASGLEIVTMRNDLCADFKWTTCPCVCVPDDDEDKA